MTDKRGTTPGPQTRIERLIAAGRITLAAFSLVGVWLDPLEPTLLRAETYTLLAAYLAYSVVLGVVVSAFRVVPRRLPIATHIVDLALFVAFVYLTTGPNSPFFAYFTFATVAGTLRWHWRGAAWTAGLSLFAFLGVGWLTARVAEDPVFELNRFIIRAVYLVVVAVLLAYLGAAVERGRSEITRLATWPERALVDEAALIEGILRHAVSTTGVERVLLVWEDADEPWVNYGLMTAGKAELWREPPPTDLAVTEALAGSDFLCADVTAREPEVARQLPDGSFADWRGAPVNASLVARVRMKSVVGIRLQGRSVSGHVFLLDMPRPTSDTLILGQVVGQQVATALDHFVLGRRSQSAALVGERIRMSQDLHDGVLQSLTGIGLRLRALDRLLADDRPGAQKEVAELESLVKDEQRSLRLLVTELSDDGVSHDDEFRTLATRLDGLAERLERVWRIRVDRDLCAFDREYPAAFTAAVARIMHEAVVNAARHGRARIVTVTAARSGDGTIGITVADDGAGFAEHGRFDLTTVTDRRMGPFTLRDRVVALGGTLTIESSPGGATLDIVLPEPGDIG